MIVVDMDTQAGCVAYLVDLRLACRKISTLLDRLHDASHWRRRYAKLLREKNCPILNRKADTVEREANRIFEETKEARCMMREWGRDLFRSAALVDDRVPQSMLLDLLGVNVADRGRVSSDDGLIEIAYIKGLEDSATYRGSDWKQGPLAQAMMRFMNHELIHNEQLKHAAHETLFGKGGMFEFLPTYRQAPSGELVRNPPKLRLACDKDAAA